MNALNQHEAAVKLWAGISLSSSFVTMWHVLPTILGIITAVLTIALTTLLIIGQRKKNANEDAIARINAKTEIQKDLEIERLRKSLGDANAN